MPTSDAGSHALALRPSGDVEIVHDKSLLPRAQGTASLYTASAASLSALAMAICYRYPGTAPCIAIVGVAAANTLHDLVHKFYDLKDERLRNAIELEKMNVDLESQKVALEKAKLELKNYAELETYKLAEARFNHFKNTLADANLRFDKIWEPRLRTIETLAEQYSSEMASDAAAIRKEYDQVVKLGNQITEVAAKDKSTGTFSAWKKSEEGVTTVKAWEDGQNEVVTKIEAMEKSQGDLWAELSRLKAASEQVKDYGMVQAMPGAFPDENTDTADDPNQGEVVTSRRGFPTILTPDATQNCGRLLCHHVWDMNTIASVSRKRELAQYGTIWDTTSSRLDEFLEDALTFDRRDDDDDDYNFDVYCDEQEVLVDGDQYYKPLYFRMVATMGTDYASLDTLFNLSQSQTTWRSMVNDSLASDLTTGEWICTDVDSDNGGAPAVQAAAIVTWDLDLLHRDAVGLLDNCSTLLEKKYNGTL